jgi:short-subunit dehydrogenase
MNLQLDGKRAVISGSTAGIGYAIAEALAREGTRVVITGRSERSVDEARARLRGATTVDVDGFAGDLGTAAAAESLTRTFRDIDIVVNNLGIFEPKPFDEIPDDD